MASLRKQFRHYVFARHRRSPLVTRLVRTMDKYIKVYHNHDCCIATNGEQDVLQKLGQYWQDAAPVLFDVGANEGDWCLTAKRFMPQAAVHCFELVDGVAGRLGNNTAHLDGVHINAFGLSNENGTITVYCRDDNLSVLSSTGQRAIHGNTFQEKQAEVKRGDAYCRERGIQHIDFLKIDVEGAERQVLEGFGDMLRSGQVTAIQFECNAIAKETRFFLGDFYKMLQPLGYAIGQVYPHYVEFRDYNIHQHELFMESNYLAVRTDQKELMGLLSR